MIRSNDKRNIPIKKNAASHEKEGNGGEKEGEGVEEGEKGGGEREKEYYCSCQKRRNLPATDIQSRKALHQI